MWWCSSVAKLCPTLCDLMDYSTSGFPALHYLLELAQTHVHWIVDAIQPCHPLSPLIFSTIGVFSNELALHIWWPKCLSFSFSISSSTEYSGLISFRIDWFNLLEVQGTLESLLQHAVWKYQFFSTQPSLWSNFHICTWLLEKPQLWLYEPLQVNWCFCFLIFFLGIWEHNFSSKEQVSFNFMTSHQLQLFQPKKIFCHCFRCFPIYLPWSDGTGCHDLLFLNVEFWVLSQLFHSPLSPSARGALVPLCFLPLGWCHLYIWGCLYFSWRTLHVS